MDFKQLEYIVTVAEEKKLLSAAEKLYISSSALSQHITKLENELGTSLFKRSKNGWILTRAGQIYVDMAKNVLQQQKKAILEINDIAENKVGHFTIGVTPGRGTTMFSELFPRFRERYPNIKIGLFEGTVLEACQKLYTDELDIAFLTSGFHYPNIHSRFLKKEEIVLALPKSHRLAYLANQMEESQQLPSIDMSLLDEDEFLLAGKHTTLRAIEDNIFELAGFKPKIAFETPSILTLNFLSRSGFGPSFVPAFYAEPSDDAVYFRMTPSAFWDLNVCYKTDHYLTQPEEFMISLVEEYYNK